MHTETETKVLAQVTARLRDKWPAVPSENIDDEVTAVFGQYADSKIRDFLPILVEREVSALLRARAVVQVHPPRSA